MAWLWCKITVKLSIQKILIKYRQIVKFSRKRLMIFWRVVKKMSDGRLSGGILHCYCFDKLVFWKISCWALAVGHRDPVSGDTPSGHHTPSCFASPCLLWQNDWYFGQLLQYRTQCQTFIAARLFLSFPLFINQFSTVQVKSRQLTSYKLSQYRTV